MLKRAVSIQIIAVMKELNGPEAEEVRCWQQMVLSNGGIIALKRKKIPSK